MKEREDKTSGCKGLLRLTLNTVVGLLRRKDRALLHVAFFLLYYYHHETRRLGLSSFRALTKVCSISAIRRFPLYSSTENVFRGN